MESSSPWLTEKQQRVWRQWLAVHDQLTVALHRQMHEDSGLSLPDFAVLVRLTDAADGRVRIVPLACEMSWERSRLSHHVKRMESRGLVLRQECPQDGRGAFVVITPEGQKAIEQAAPGHARTVRALMFEGLADDDLDVVADFTDRVLERLGAERPDER